MVRGGPQVIPRPNGWRPGSENPWTHRLAETDPAELFGLARVERILAAHNPETPHADGPTTPMRPPFMNATKNSAVLAALFERDGETRVLLTRRSARLRSHSHQVAFPGGRLDDGETSEQAALRETEEEVGLPRDRIRIVGQLERLTTVVSSSSITPYIGIIDGELPALTPSPREVERIFDVSLRELTDPDCYHEEIWDFADGTFPVWFFNVEEDTVWGATARMLRRMLDLVIHTNQ
jgi:8-oxo-dGTP pyrophosphatase MutT (NUDIX family)